MLNAYGVTSTDQSYQFHGPSFRSTKPDVTEVRYFTWKRAPVAFREALYYSFSNTILTGLFMIISQKL